MFSGAPTHAVEQNLIERMRQGIAAAQLPDQLDETDFEREIGKLAERFRLNEPRISTPDDGLEPSETRERAVQTDGRMSRLGMPFTENVLDIKFDIPIEGDHELLQLSPNTAVMGTGIVGSLALFPGKIVYTYTASSRMPREQLMQAIKNDLTALRRHVAAIATWTEQWNSQLAARIRPMVAQRVAELERQSAITQDLRISF